MTSLLRYSFFTGIFLAIPLLALLYLSLGMPISRVGTIYLLGYTVAVLGLLSFPRGAGRSILVSLAGLAVLLIMVTVRILFPPSGSHLDLITLPGPSGPRLLNRLFDEQDIVLFGAKVAPSVGFVSRLEYQSLLNDLSQTYHEMAAQDVTSLSPALTTYLGWQHPDGFDALVAAPGSVTSRTGIIFLHGYGGNFTLQCWLVARAGEAVNALTLCPSTGPGGQWWNEQGTAILHESINYLHQRGVERIYLAGLSNGGIGASRLAEEFKSDLTGLILISGVDPGARITGVPVLVIHGQSDGRIPASTARQYAALAPNSTYRLFEGDHFVLLKESDQVQAAIVDWLIEQEGQ